MRLIIPIISVALAFALAGIVWPLEVEHEQTEEISKLKAEIADKSGRRDSDFSVNVLRRPNDFLSFVLIIGDNKFKKYFVLMAYRTPELSAIMHGEW